MVKAKGQCGEFSLKEIILKIIFGKVEITVSLG